MTTARARDPEAAAAGLLGEALPERLRWEELTRRYPLAAVGVAAGVGAWLGWAHGREILLGLAGYAGREVADALADRS